MKPMRYRRFVCVCLVLLLLSLLPAQALAAPPYKGVDVSKWQGTVDWAKVKQSGVEFAILRCFASRKDTTFEANYAGATAQGIPVGAYVYMYARTPESAVKEAQNTLSALGGKALTLPLFLDVEDKDVKALGKETVTDLMLIELQIFAAAGYRAGIYTSLSHKSTDMDASRLNGYDWWIARWTCQTTDANPKTFTFSSQSPTGSKKPDCDLWQFSNGGKGSTYGMGSTYVDLDYCYTDYIKEGPRTPNTHRYQAEVTAATCTAPGMLTLTCQDCGDTYTGAYTKPAPGHTAPNADGRCTRCGEQLVQTEDPTEPDTPEVPDTPGTPSDPQTPDSGVCKWCGKTHDGPFGWFVQILHDIFAWFQAFGHLGF